MASEQIIQVLDALCEKFGIAVDWSNQNILPYAETLCEKFASYKIAATIIDIIFIVLLIVVGALLIKLAIYCFRRDREIDDYNDSWWIGGVFLIIVAAASIFVGMGALCLDIKAIVKWVTIPETGLLEYVSELIQ